MRVLRGPYDKNTFAPVRYIDVDCGEGHEFTVPYIPNGFMSCPTCTEEQRGRNPARYTSFMIPKL